MPDSTLFASFVGIDAYPQNPLSGCVKDVLAMDLILRQQMAQQNNTAYKPAYFLAPKPSGKEAIKDYATAQKIEELKYEAPTFNAISTKAFAHLKNAQNGDTCLFYYSGHGSQTDAPEVFWHTKPDRQNETIVCVDSRDAANAESRDIIDKELAYLLWDTVKGKEVHCLVIMDCCHSGNNTREFLKIAASDIRYRHCPSSKNKIAFEEYLGYDRGFYIMNNGNAGITTARYVHLAAARDAEKAQESSKGGLFTRKLIDALRAGGTTKSYRELVQTVAITVHNHASQQNPVAFARENEDLDFKFLGTAIKPYLPSFEVRYDFALQQWVMYGGAIHNIRPSSGTTKTIVKIVGTATAAEVTEVLANTSFLNVDALAAFDKSGEQYSAVISSMASPRVTIGLAETVWQQPLFVQILEAAFNNTGHLHYTIDFNNAVTDADYVIQLTVDYDFILTKPDGQLPLFRREKDVSHFLQDVEAVSKWTSVTELNNANTAFTKDDFIFCLEKLEGKNIIPGNSEVWSEYAGQSATIIPGTEQVFNYKDDKQPAYRFSITLKNTAISSCYIGALYMDSLFGISYNLIQSDAGRLLNNGTALQLCWNFNGKDHKTIVLKLDKAYRNNYVNEITEFLKIFVATEPVNLERYQQASLKPDVMRSTSKSMGFDDADSDRGAEQRPDWAVFTFPFRIVGSAKEKKLEQGIPADFASFTIEAPENFTAMVYAATGNDVLQKLNTITSNGDAAVQQLSQMIAPPESIWENVLSSETLFNGRLSQASAGGTQVLELFADNNGDVLQLHQGEEILIRPKLNDRTVEDGMKETIVPFGYDGEAQRLGVTDDAGVIHIQQLPHPTPGIIRGPSVLSHNSGTSIKLFFRKIFETEK